MFHSTKALLMLSTLLIIICATKAFADNVDISEFEVLTPDEFQELVAGKTIAGVYNGNEYAELYTQDKRVNGKVNGASYSGRWTAGKDNCVLSFAVLSDDTLPDTTPHCWKLLHKDGKYIFGQYNREGAKLLISHYATIVD
jgi:hypothetical protein